MTAYRIGGYVRFSSKEDNTAESNSISSQKNIISEFINQLSFQYSEDFFELQNFYVDDDWSGTNFDRPGFMQLKKDCKAGLINCILVKDHSRFGRNASRMQLLLEDDLEDIRYLSILDRFDSRIDDYDSMFQIKNTFNQMYAEDICRKVHSSIDSRQIRGDFIGSFACYGYAKSPEDKHRLIVDENVRSVVETIFKLRLQGMNIQSIVRYLNHMEILCPSEYKKSCGLNYVNPQAALTSNRPLWTFSTVHRMLTNETYMGNLVQGRKYQKMRKKPKMKKRENWVVAPHTVPPIVTPEVFEQVQFMMKAANHIKAVPNSEEHIFSGLIKCGECGKSFVKHQKNHGECYFVCGTRRRHGKSECDNEYIRYETLANILTDDFNTLLSHTGDLNELVKASGPSDTAKTYEKEICKKKAAIEHFRIVRRTAYLDVQKNFISREDFLNIRNETEKSESALSKQVEELQASMKYNCGTRPQWILSLLNKQKVTAPDRIMVQEMLEGIYIFKHNRIKLTYRFIPESPEFKNVLP